MTDIAVAASGVLSVVGVWVVVRILQPVERNRYRAYRALIVPALVGFLAGRIGSLVVSLSSRPKLSSDLSILDGGLEIWVGVFSAMGWVAWRSRRKRMPLWFDVSELMAPLLFGSAVYEAACVLRSSCGGADRALSAEILGSNRGTLVHLVAAVLLSATAILLHKAWTLDRRLVCFFTIVSLALVRTGSSFVIRSDVRGATLYRSAGAVIATIVFMLGSECAVRLNRHVAADQKGQQTTGKLEPLTSRGAAVHAAGNESQVRAPEEHAVERKSS